MQLLPVQKEMNYLHRSLLLRVPNQVLLRQPKMPIQPITIVTESPGSWIGTDFDTQHLKLEKLEWT
jgi:hypothetical protein